MSTLRLSYSNTALFWVFDADRSVSKYDTRLGRRWNVDPKPNASVSQYAAFENNPIFFSDVQGDSVNHSDIYRKDDKGNYVNEQRIKDFETFASTDAGNQYILDHAENGYKLQGVFNTNLNIEATEEGKYSKGGVDVTFGLSDNISDHVGASTTSHIEGGILNIYNEPSRGGGGRLKTSYLFPSQYKYNPFFSCSTLESNLSGINDIFHEVFLHGESTRNSYFKGVTSSLVASSNGGDHGAFMFNSSTYANQGLNMLKNAQTILNGGNSQKVISDVRLNYMIQWGRGAAGWFFIMNGREGKENETVNFNDVVQKASETK